MTIRRYVKDYIEYFPEEWSWEPKQEDSELWMKYRARKSDSRFPYKNLDIWPDFTSIEKDANRFGYSSWGFTDYFGIRYEGRKGIHRCMGAPDYEGHLYYYDIEADEMEVDYDVTDSKDKPNPEIYYEFEGNVSTEWLDFKNITDFELHFCVITDHVFKDAFAELYYGSKNELETIYSIKELYKGLKKFGKETLLKKLYDEVDDYFITLETNGMNEAYKEIKGTSAIAFFERYDKEDE